MEGTIKTLTDRGFGFIAREGEKKDLFFHARNLVDVRYDELAVGDTLQFDTEEGEKGLCAINIIRI